MNLVELYISKIQFEAWGPYKKVKVLDAPKVESYMRNYNLIEKGQVYEVTRIKKCSGNFKCAQTCTTNCYAFHVKAWDENSNSVIETNTCGCILGNSSGEPIKLF